MRIYFTESVKDFPKKAGDLHLAWYQNGRVCISRALKSHQMQTQNFNIIKVNQITKAVWDKLDLSFKKDLARYAEHYKKAYPNLRKRGISAYSAFLMVIHVLIRRFAIDTSHHANTIVLFERLLDQVTVYKLIQLRILKKVKTAYRLRHCNYINYDKKSPLIRVYLRKIQIKQIKSEVTSFVESVTIDVSTFYNAQQAAFT